MAKKILIAVWIACLAFFPVTTRAQQTPAPHTPAKRPTVGLVLSGGGARGFAHIGVLKVLEENHIPVDYIGGASMGGLIGAIYATGKSPAEIEAVIGTLDWSTLLQPSTSFDNLSFRRKEDRRNLPAPVTLKGKVTDLKLPNALNNGHQIGLLFDRLTLPYATVTDFSELPIPFRTVGTDMVNGESVTLDKGPLSRALRATMSIPGVFAPVEVNNRILADGGLVNNIPTDVVKAMGADILIVVNIETKLGGRDALDSLPSLLTQSLNIATLDNSRRSLRQADFIISPDLGENSVADFSKSKDIIALGYAGATQKVPLLKSLALDDADWAAHLRARQARRLPEAVPVPEFVAVEGTNPDATRAIQEKLRDKYDGQPLDTVKQKELARDLTDLTGTGRFESIDYGLTTESGKTGLLITPNEIMERPERPTRLEIGLDVNSVESDNVNFNFLARLTVFNIGIYGSEWRNDLRLGSNTFLASEYYRPIGRSNFFVAPRVSYERRRINLFTEGTRIAEYVGQTTQIGADIGYQFNSRSELRAGYTAGYQNFSRRVGDPLLPNLKGTLSAAGLRWTYDSLDKAQVPTNGILARSTANYFFKSAGAGRGFAQAETVIRGFYPLNERNTFFAFGGGGTSFGENASTVQQFTLGGPFRLGGYGFEELRASNYMQAGAGVLHNPENFPTFLGGKTYIGAWYEAGSAYERLANANYRQSFSGGVILETPVGPVFIGGSFNENGRGRFYFSFGRIFK